MRAEHTGSGRDEAHHLVDPRNRWSAASDLAQATVIADDAGTADVLAKTAFLLGDAAARGWLAGLPDVAAVLVLRDGSVATVGLPEVVDA